MGPRHGHMNHGYLNNNAMGMQAPAVPDGSPIGQVCRRVFFGLCCFAVAVVSVVPLFFFRGCIETEVLSVFCFFAMVV